MADLLLSACICMSSTHFIRCLADSCQGQIIAATSYQITLLTGQNGQKASSLYIVASIYLVASLFWWLLFRTMKSIYLLSLPFLLYGLAFFSLGLGPYATLNGSRDWVNNIATALYAFASASGSFYFALNFGTEGEFCKLIA